MTETIIIDSIDGVMKLIAEQNRNGTIDRLRSTYYYRGLSDTSFNLTTSLRTNCKHLSKQLEPSVLQAFSNYASMEDPFIVNSIWKLMMVGQHHGLPTRLLDWTYSPLIALHFAENENNLQDLSRHDCAVWRMDIRECNTNLPEKYKDALRQSGKNVFSLDTLTKVVDSIEHYDNDMGDKAFVTIEPPSIDQRIVNQYSFFSIIPSEMENIESFLNLYTAHTVKYIIKKEIRWDVRDLLDQFNVSERILYPGLDGLSKTLARHYFVK